jgi:ABC-type Fe3+-citrate transport system substrate-binding protein
MRYRSFRKQRSGLLYLKILHLILCIDTDNQVNRISKTGGYDHVTEYTSIGQPNADTLAKLSALQPGPMTADGDFIPCVT